MTDVRKVWPKEALEAVWPAIHNKDTGWRIDGLPGLPLWFTDAEFAAAFVDAAVLTELIDAAVLTELIDAVREVTGELVAALDEVRRKHVPSCICWGCEGKRDDRPTPGLARAIAAFAAFDAVMLPEKMALLVYGDTVRKVPAGSLTITLTGPVPDTETQ